MSQWYDSYFRRRVLFDGLVGLFISIRNDRIIAGDIEVRDSFFGLWMFDLYSFRKERKQSTNWMAKFVLFFQCFDLFHVQRCLC
jgi:hypothetical protein